MALTNLDLEGYQVELEYEFKQLLKIYQTGQKQMQQVSPGVVGTRSTTTSDALMMQMNSVVNGTQSLLSSKAKRGYNNQQPNTGMQTGKSTAFVADDEPNMIGSVPSSSDGFMRTHSGLTTGP